MISYGSRGETDTVGPGEFISDVHLCYFLDFLTKTSARPPPPPPPPAPAPGPPAAAPRASPGDALSAGAGGADRPCRPPYIGAKAVPGGSEPRRSRSGEGGTRGGGRADAEG